MDTTQLDYDALPPWKQRVVDTMEQDFHRQTEQLDGGPKTSYALKQRSGAG